MAVRAMKTLFLAVVLGIVASFGLTILSEVVLFSSWMPKSARLLFAEFPVVAVVVGILVGFIAKERARVAAGLSLAPWAAWLIVATNWTHSTISRWATTVIVISLCVALGICAAHFVGRRSRAACASQWG